MTVQNSVGTVLLCCAENGCWGFIPCNITLTSARWCKFTTPSSMEKYRIITHFTLLVDDYSPLRGPPDPSGWCPPPLGKSPRPLRMIFPLESRWDLSEWVPSWEVPHTSQNDFPLGKALRPLGMSFPLGSPLDFSEWFSPWEVPQTPQNDFPPGKSPRPLRIKKVMPLSTTKPSLPPDSWALFHLTYSCLHDVFLIHL